MDDQGKLAVEAAAGKTVEDQDLGVQSGEMVDTAVHDESPWSRGSIGLQFLYISQI